MTTTYDSLDHSVYPSTPRDTAYTGMQKPAHVYENSDEYHDYEEAP